MSLRILQERIELLTLLKDYLARPTPELEEIYYRAQQQNSWFTLENIELAIQNIIDGFLSKQKLQSWASSYQVAEVHSGMIKNVGIIMAGNLPLVGFHDVLCTFISGHKSVMKLSSKDSVIWKHLVAWLEHNHSEATAYFEIKDQIAKCDAYIATGSNNTSRYFESFFEKYPHIIRKNRSSVAVLQEADSVQNLLQDVISFFGLGCRNVSQVYVPEGYDLNKILHAFEGNEVLKMHNGYNNNFDYHLAIYLLNRVPIQYNEQLILVENSIVHAPIGTLHYQYYRQGEAQELIKKLVESEDVQCVSTNINDVQSNKVVPLGNTQQPQLFQYPDGVDVMAFLKNL